MTPSDKPLLGQDEPAPAMLFNAAGLSPFLILGDHAGNAIPRALDNLGLEAVDRERHIAWDIGVRHLGMRLAKAFDAPFIHQHYSRLVIDCNRDPRHPEAAPAVADGSRVTGNEQLKAGDFARRVAAIHTPYHQRIAQELERRTCAKRPTILLALHSFTPVLAGERRPWQIGVLHESGDTRFARALLAALRERGDIIVGENEPYRMDSNDYSVPRHAYSRALAYAEIEVRQDLIVDPAGTALWGEVLASSCETALRAAIGSQGAGTIRHNPC